jgi:DNA invertase Pin-like site-specific DNA recombinase
MESEMTNCLAYLRTSSQSNVDGDSETRQLDAISHYAKTNKLNIVGSYWDKAVSGEDDISERPQFSAMLDHIEGNGVRMVVVEGADRLARSVMAQELAVMACQERGIQIITSSGQNLTESDDPAKVAMRQMASVFSQFEKSRLVGKLAAARKRKREADGKCEGRKSLSETNPTLLKRAKALRRKDRTSGKRRTYYRIAKMLADEGFRNSNGNPYDKNQIKKLCEV